MKTAVLLLGVFLREDSFLELQFWEGSTNCPVVTRILRSIDCMALKMLCREVNLCTSAVPSGGNLALRRLQDAGLMLWSSLLDHDIKAYLSRAMPGSELLLMVDERLLFIPWELFFDSRDFFCLKFNISRIMVCSHGQKRDHPEVDPYSMLIYSRNGRLKGPAEEGRRLKRIFQLNERLQTDFITGERSILEFKKLVTTCAMLHFAGHLPGNIRQAGWMMEDGIFSASDVNELAEALSLPWFIFSNSCMPFSGRPYGGVESCLEFETALLRGGAKCLICTRGSIQDKAAMEFSLEFYRSFIAGVRLGECLRLARIKTIAAFGADSLHWSKYVLYGDPGLVLRKARVWSCRRINGVTNIHIRR